MIKRMFCTMKFDTDMDGFLVQQIVVKLHYSQQLFFNSFSIIQIHSQINFQNLSEQTTTTKLEIIKLASFKLNSRSFKTKALHHQTCQICCLNITIYYGCMNPAVVLCNSLKIHCSIL